MRLQYFLVPMRRPKVLRELIVHVALLAVVLLSGMGFFGLILVLAAHSLVFAVPFRGAKQELGLSARLGSLLAVVAFSAFLILMIAAWYGSSVGASPDDDMLGFTLIMATDLALLLPWGAGFIVVHLVIIWIHRLTRPPPRPDVGAIAVEEFSISLMVLLGMMFLMTCMILLLDGGLFVWRFVNLFLPWLSLDECIAVVTVSGRLFIALTFPRDTEREVKTAQGGTEASE